MNQIKKHNFKNLQYVLQIYYAKVWNQYFPKRFQKVKRRNLLSKKKGKKLNKIYNIYFELTTKLAKYIRLLIQNV